MTEGPHPTGLLFMQRFFRLPEAWKRLRGAGGVGLRGTGPTFSELCSRGVSHRQGLQALIHIPAAPGNMHCSPEHPAGPPRGSLSKEPLSHGSVLTWSRDPDAQPAEAHCPHGGPHWPNPAACPSPTLSRPERHSSSPRVPPVHREHTCLQRWKEPSGKEENKCFPCW